MLSEASIFSRGRGVGLEWVGGKVSLVLMSFPGDRVSLVPCSFWGEDRVSRKCGRVSEG